jgi:hypothetical protein
VIVQGAPISRRDSLIRTAVGCSTRGPQPAASPAASAMNEAARYNPVVMSEAASTPPVAITFECTPLRSVPRLDIPLDASPGYRARLERMQRAVAAHGTRNAYYLTDGSCTFRFTNDPAAGWVRFRFDGTVFTDEADLQTTGSDLEIAIDVETCDWLTQPAVEWLTVSVKHAVETEFDRYIAAGDLAKARERLAREQARSDEAGGYLGMNL